MSKYVSLRRLFAVVNGGTPTPDIENWGGDVRWATPVDLAKVDGGTLDTTERTLTRVGLETGSRSVPGGSLVLSTRAPTGYVASTTQDLAFNQGCRGLVPRDPESVDIRYVKYQLHARRHDLQAAGNGTTFQELPTDALGSFEVAYASVDQQRRIADFLDAETSRIDALITAKQRMIGAITQRDTAVLDQAFGCEARRIRFDGVPDGVGAWPRSRLGSVASVQSGITIDAGRELDQSVTVPYLRVANVQDGHVDIRELKLVSVNGHLADRHRLRTGDVLMTEGGDPDKLGRGAVWHGSVDPCLHQNHVFAVRPDPEVLDGEFLAMLTRTTYARAYFEMTATRTTGIASTSASKISGFGVPVPPLDEQVQMVDRIKRQMRAHQDLSTTLTRQTELLRERRQALITAAVTGELAVG